ncbi:MAG: hypothetical protein LBT20_04760 [Clostridiales bacterium]|jgi:hypothetical protein|nr:hypothetical protein [Clostridiales bacterium]
MYLKYVFSITFSNLNLVFKTLLYSLAAIVIAAAIGAGVLVPTLRPIYDEIMGAGYLDAVGATVEKVLNGSYTVSKAADTIGAMMDEVALIIASHSGKLYLSYVFLGFLLFLIGFLRAFFDIGVASSASGYMSAKMRSKLLPAAFSRMGRSAGYAGLKTLVSGAATILIFLAVGFFIRYTAPFLNIFSAAIGIAMLIGLFSVKFAFLSRWVPRVAEGEKVVVALKQSLKVQGFSMRFSSALLLYTTIVISVLTLTLPTFGFFLILIFPVGNCMLRVMEMVNYYVENKRKFYTDDFVVIG